jgi:hypothetical protein
MRYAYGWSTWHSPFREPSTNKIINFGRSLQAFLGIFPDPAGLEGRLARLEEKMGTTEADLAHLTPL